jgi:beta-N-acetylhexosaminidase
LFPQYALAVPRNFLPLLVLFTLLGSAALTRDKHHTPAPPPPPAPVVVTEHWAESTLGTLSLEEKVGQLFMVRMRVEFLGNQSPEYLRLRDSIRKYHVGSLAMSIPAAGHFLNGNDRYQTVTLMNQLQSESKLPLLVAGDFERRNSAASPRRKAAPSASTGTCFRSPT